ncbi:hypothetical protein BFU36_13175 [Sulfolobus sp. A20]|nr:hypothetical protein BFU36_13175 [Sulfolobus sp. A20]TRM81535.1 hypothetical protein DJ522_07810 [Sulfolobus sp. F3]TRM95561.1 hypothetical protein DJ526_00290 [Sulfolobus sp. A20-N-G8]
MKLLSTHIRSDKRKVELSLKGKGIEVVNNLEECIVKFQGVLDGISNKNTLIVGLMEIVKILYLHGFLVSCR